MKNTLYLHMFFSYSELIGSDGGSEDDANIKCELEHVYNLAFLQISVHQSGAFRIVANSSSSKAGGRRTGNA
jgi:hypothetical protein